ncbi:MAG: hypothetical protein AB2793_12435 [Candidatus Thiodiazotropha sp.]
MNLVQPMMNKLKPIWLWIKSNHHPIRVFGGIFFVLALVSGIAWALGADIEPVAFLFGLLSSLAFASPSIAEYFLPSRKPIRDMTFKDILEFIPTTDPESDWCGINKGWMSESFLKEDPRLRFRAKFTEEHIQNENFIEPWANGFHHKQAVGYWYELFYDGAFLHRIVMVSVDGGRALIPCPELQTSEISKFNYHVGRLFDTLGSMDSYIEKAGLSVEDT